MPHMLGVQEFGSMTPLQLTLGVSCVHHLPGFELEISVNAFVVPVLQQQEGHSSSGSVFMPATHSQLNWAFTDG